ncbi:MULTISPECIES: class I SAM-dependent methyltransferase [Candidatus Kuenenia]|uniref:class I SAM-dependent methyltransferase n=1 Tax=Candidatus Kuenenia TaxID=380738 RepID=UPI0013EAB104|nr:MULTISPECIES: class I SAM-dependent methyltransferase [Kuenenia]MCZ7621572.1 class I SAM-dependent methyltransferase [Candidatus Kuenenia sp.]
MRKALQKIFKIIALRKIRNSKYNQIVTHLTEDEKLVLYNLSKKLENGMVMVEVGSYLGASACFLAWGCSKKTNIFYCIDTWENDSMTEGKRDTYNEFIFNTKDFKDLIKPLRGNSVDVAKTFQGEINLLFIDGDHSYESCLQDWVSWEPFLDRNAIVVFHDIGWAEGVQRVVQEKIVPIAKKEKQLPNLYWAWI